MNRWLKLLIVPFLVLFLFPGVAMATNITIWDENARFEDGWYGKGEDQEVEPGMVNNQIWDLEGFLLNGSTLTIVGGYNFETGVQGMFSGDIFIDTNGDAEFGTTDRDGANGVNTVLNSYGYDYVIDLNFETLDYSVYQINASSRVNTAYYTQNEGSSPWTYHDGGSGIGAAGGPLEVKALNDLDLEGLGVGGVDIVGGDHYAFSVSLDFLGVGQEFIAHYTMECGNDNLMGHGTTAPVPEPATMLLLGTGLIGLAGVSRKKFKK